MARANIADVICIGAQKAGTSWLHYALQAHPALHAFPNRSPITSTNKEAHFWDWNRERGVEWYRDLLRPPEERLLSMDFTPEYALMSDEQIRECKLLNPTASIIYLVRDPVERALSALQMYRRSGTRPSRITLDAAFHEELAKFRVLEHSDYAANFDRWRRHYGDRILVVNYRDVLFDPVGVRNRAIAFLGPPTVAGDGASRRAYARRTWSWIWVGEAISVDRDARAHLEERLAQARREAETRFGFELAISTKDRLAAAARRFLRLAPRRA